MTLLTTEIRCSTCFYHKPGQGCQLDPQVCVEPRRANGEFAYHSWVERIAGRSYADYFDAGGEAIRKSIDDAILSDIAEAAREGDRPREVSWKRLFIGLCVAYTALGLSVNLFYLALMLYKNFIASH